MAEAFAPVGLAVTVVQIVEFETKVVKRLNEFSSDLRQTPIAFRHIQSQLPLILGALQGKWTQGSNEYAHLPAGDGLKNCVMGCLGEVKQLDDILANIVPLMRFQVGDKDRQAALKSL